MAKKVKSIDILKEKLDLYRSNPAVIMKQYKLTLPQYKNIVAELEEKINQSKRGKSSKSKGGEYERNVARKMKEKLGVELTRTPSSGGFKKDVKGTSFKGDISNLDDNITFMLHIECKNQKSWSLPAWFKQAEEDCPEGRIPTVIFHRGQKNVEGKREQTAQDFITLKLDDFLDIVDSTKIIVPRSTRKTIRKRVNI